MEQITKDIDKIEKLLNSIVEDEIARYYLNNHLNTNDQLRELLEGHQQNIQFIVPNYETYIKENNIINLYDVVVWNFKRTGFTKQYLTHFKFTGAATTIASYIRSPNSLIPRSSPVLFIYKLANIIVNGLNTVYHDPDYKTHKNQQQTKDVAVENPDGEMKVGKKDGGTLYRKTTLKKRIAGRERVIYLGKNNKHFIKRKGVYVAVKDCDK